MPLTRSVQRPCDRRTTWLLIAGGCAANLVVLAALLRPLVTVTPAIDTRVETRVLGAVPLVSPPAVVQITLPAPAAARSDEDLGPCPEPYRGGGGAREVAIDEDVDRVYGVTASATDTRRVAYWSSAALYASDDGGRRFVRVLDGPGRVRSAVFDCHGRLWALRDQAGLGVHDDQRGERWRTLTGVRLAPYDPDPATVDDEPDPRYAPVLWSGGDALAVVGSTGDDGGPAEAMITRDGGASWRYVELGWYEGADVSGGFDDAGRLRAMVPWTDCMDEGLRLITADGRGTTTGEVGAWAAASVMVGGRIYGETWNCPGADVHGEDPRPLCTWTRGGGWQPVAGVDGDGATLVRGAADLAAAITGDQVVNLQGARAVRPRAWEAGAQPLTVDAAGRVWGVSGQRLIRR